MFYMIKNVYLCKCNLLVDSLGYGIRLRMDGCGGLVQDRDCTNHC